MSTITGSSYSNYNTTGSSIKPPSMPTISSYNLSSSLQNIHAERMKQVALQQANNQKLIDEAKQKEDAAKLEAQRIDAAKLEAQRIEAAKLEAQRIEAAKVASEIARKKAIADARAANAVIAGQINNQLKMDEQQAIQNAAIREENLQKANALYLEQNAQKNALEDAANREQYNKAMEYASKYLGVMGSNSVRSANLVSSIQGSVDGRRQGLEKTERTQFNKFAYKTGSKVNFDNIFPKVNTSDMKLEDIDKATKQMKQDYNFSFIKINPTPETTNTIHKKCVTSGEYETKPPMSMTRLDNNYHTFDSCRLKSALNGYKYMSIVKPPDSVNIDSKLYECHVTNEEIPVTANYFDYESIWTMGPTVTGMSINADGDLIISADDISKIGPIERMYSDKLSTYTFGSESTYVTTIIQPMNIVAFDITQVNINGGMIGGGWLQTPLPVNNSFLLKDTNDTFILSNYDGRYTRMLLVNFSIYAGSLYVTLKGARFSKLGRYVRIRAPSYGEAIIQISQIVVLNYKNENVALNKPAYAKDFGNESKNVPSNAVDGTLSNKSWGSNKLYTSASKNNGWWMVDLQNDTNIKEIVYYNRAELTYRSNNAIIEVISSANEVIYSSVMNADKIQTFNVNASGNAEGDYTLNSENLNKAWENGMDTDIATDSKSGGYGLFGLKVDISPYGQGRGISGYDQTMNKSYVNTSTNLYTMTNTTVNNCIAKCDIDENCAGFESNETAPNSVSCNFKSINDISGEMKDMEKSVVYKRKQINAPMNSSVINLTKNTQKFDLRRCLNGVCKFRLELSNDGNLTLYRTIDTEDIIWNLFSHDSSILDKLSAIAPISNPEWKTSFLTNSNILSQDESIPAKKPHIISPNGMFKLEVNNGFLTLKASVYGCKSSDPKLRVKAPLYTNTVQNKSPSYYVYENALGEARQNTIYQRVSGPGGNALMEIPENHPLVQSTNTYTKYNGYFPAEDVNMQTSSKLDINECMQKCSNDNECHFGYSYLSNGSPMCVTGKGVPGFTPNQTNPSDKSSTLFIKNKQINLDKVYKSNNPMKPDIEIVNTSMPFALYPVGQKVENENDLGISGIPPYRAIKERELKLQFGDNIPTKEGFDSYGYSNPGKNCGRYDKGCQDQVLNRQLAPLMQISQDYNKQINSISQNYNDISGNIDQYNVVRNIMDSDSKYDFNKDQRIVKTDETDLKTEMQKDAQLMALEANNMYIAGSILTATLLVSALYLGSE